MLRLPQIQGIVLAHFRDGKSQREISRDFGVDRKTIRKYIRQYEEQGKGSINTNVLIEEPHYRVGVRHKRKVTEEIEQKIRRLIVDNKSQKPIDIYRCIKAQGMEISYSTVLRTIRTIRLQLAKEDIRGSDEPSTSKEYGRCEVQVMIDGKLHKLQITIYST